MMFRTFVSLLAVFAVAETCVPTVPPEEYYPTSTLPPYEPTTKPAKETTTQDEETTKQDEEKTTVQSTTGEATTMRDQCDINDIAPDLDELNTEFFSEQRDPVDGRLRIYTGCRRTDSMICSTVSMFGETATGTQEIGDSSNNIAVYSTLSYDEDCTYSWMDVTGITKLICVWDTCF